MGWNEPDCLPGEDLEEQYIKWAGLDEPEYDEFNISISFEALNLHKEALDLLMRELKEYVEDFMYEENIKVKNIKTKEEE